MDKLIRFINEYGHTNNCGPFETCRIEPATDYISSYLVLSRDDNGEGDWKDWHLEVPRLISKEYGFIGWLVENDKIDFSLIPNKIKEIGIPMKINGEIKYGFDSSDYYWLLMLLSISDTPIDDLISYLK